MFESRRATPPAGLTRWLRYLILAATALVLAGCGQQDSDEPASSRPASTALEWDAAAADRARLIERLPETTWAYVRVPMGWGVLAAPKDNALGSALESEANRSAVADLQVGMRETIQTRFPDYAPLLDLLFDAIRSPVEIALVGEGDQPMNADIIIEARVGFDSLEAVNARIEELTAMHPMARLIRPADSDQSGQIFFGPSSIYFDFDLASQRLLMASGLAVNEDSLVTARGWSAREGSGLHAMERRIDSSRRGLVAWADAARMRPMIESMLPADVVETLRGTGVLYTDAIALGFGTADGKGQLALVASGSTGPIWDLTLPAMPAPSISTAGVPGTIAGMTIPGWSWVQGQLVPLLAADKPDFATGWAEVQSTVEDVLGVSLEQVIDSLAGRMIYVVDDNGPYYVHQPVRPGELTALATAVAGRFEIEATTRQVEGRTLHHLAIPGMDFEGMADEQSQDPDMPASSSRPLEQLVALYSSIGTHVYWVEDGDHTLFASVPQVLIDRVRHASDQPLDDHLQATGQKIDTAAVFGSVRLNDAARRNYYAYLQVLNGLADALDVDVDLMEFPTARELDLPERGDVGLRLDFADRQLGLAMTFENHPGDALYSPSSAMTLLAGGGLLAAIAVPAYQDYLTRTHIATAMKSADRMQFEIDRFRLEQKRWPEEEEIETVMIEDSGPVRAVYYLANPPVIVIELNDEERLVLLPDSDRADEAGPGAWTCISEGVREKWLPAECR